MASQKGIGRLIQVGLAKEATRGTAESSATFWVPWMDLTLDEKKEFAIDEQAYGIVEDNVNLTQTKKWAQGTLQGNVHDQTFGLVLYSMFGGYAVSGTGPYVHTFTVGESAQHQSLTFFKHDPLTAQDYKYANGVVEKLEITAELKKFVAYNATIKAKSGATATSFTPSTTTENRFLPQFLSAKFASTVSGLSSATAIALKSVKLTINANVEDQDVLGSLDPADFLNKEFMVEGTLEAILQNESDFKTAFMGPTAQAMSLDFVNSDVTINTSSHPELKFTLAKATFQDYGTPYKVKDLVYQTVKFKGSYSLSDTYMIEAVLTNDTTTY
jgi:Phage tail tube protein